MDADKKRKKQFIKRLILQMIMVVAVLFMMLFFILWALGYKINSDGRLEQNGLIHVVSTPSGASVMVDGKRNFMRTGVSKMLSAGVHNVLVEKPGFSPWQKDVSVRAGIYTQLFYIRLLPEDKKQEKVRNIKEPIIWSVSPGRDKVLYFGGDEPEWRLIDLKNPEESNDVKLDFSEFLGGSGAVLGRDVKVISMEWSRNNSNVLLKVKNVDKEEWVLLNLRNPTESINITKKMAINIDKLKIMNGGADKLWALESGNLREIRIRDLVMSQVLIDGVEDFYSNENIISYVANQKEERYLGIYKEGDRAGVKLADLRKEDKAMAMNMRYYGDDYMVTIVNEEATIKKGKLPVEEKEGQMIERRRLKIGEMPEEMMVSENNQLLVMRKGGKNIVINLENEQVYKYSLPIGGMIDGMLFWLFEDGKLYMQDFDGTNKREIAKGEGLPAVVTQDGGWLYFVARPEVESEGAEMSGLELRRIDILP